MASRQTTQSHTTEAQLLVMPRRADAMTDFAAPTDEAVMDRSLSARSQSTNRKLRSAIVLATALCWVVIALVIRWTFY